MPCCCSIDLSDLELWETNTLTSALKSYLRNLPEPLMTFELHRAFIDAAKKDFPADRVRRCSCLFSVFLRSVHDNVCNKINLIADLFLKFLIIISS